jgi:hypothetical protein
MAGLVIRKAGKWLSDGMGWPGDRPGGDALTSGFGLSSLFE